MNVSRRDVLVAGAATVAVPAVSVHAGIRDDADSSVFDSPDLAQQVVGASHFNFERVRELVSERPELAKASWDWGFGDWETALGAASHTGQREIALFLIEHGARPTLFTHAMLGDVAVVRAVAETSPDQLATTGPHGITLMDHARAGREHAAEVVELLEQFPESDRGEVSLEVEDARVYTAPFRCADGRTIGVTLNRRDRLVLKVGDGVERPINRTGEHVFAPSGSPTTRIVFEVDGNRAQALVIQRAGHELRGERTW